MPVKLDAENMKRSLAERAEKVVEQGTRKKAR